MGATYHQGYLEVFGLDDSLFPLATDKSLLSGFLALVTFGLVPMLYTMLAVLALVFTVLIAAVLSSNPKVKYWQTIILEKLAGWCFRNKPSQAMVDLIDKGATIYGYSVGIFLGIFSLVLVAVLSAKSGHEQASKEINSFKIRKGNYAILHTPFLSAPTRAKQIICSQSHCEFWLGDETLVLKHENIGRVIMHNPQFQGAQHP